MRTIMKASTETYRRIFEEAHSSGMSALKTKIPMPMIVGTPTTPLGNKIDYSKPTYVVDGGMCGFAWIKLCDGRSSFSRWVVKTNRGRKSYEGGVKINVHTGGQSIEKKEAYAKAFVEVLRKNGIECYADSRLD